MTGEGPSRSRHASLLSGASAGFVERAYVEGAAAHGQFALDRREFLGAVEERARRHWAGQGVEVDAERAATYVERAALTDLYLAVACDKGDERAWVALSRGLRPRLEGLAVRRGASSAEAQAVVQDVFGDLALPPPGGVARTLVGTFDGTGSLAGWLSIVVLRRLAAKARGRKVASLDGASEPQRESAATFGRREDAVGPAERAAGEETDRRFRAALAAVWPRLSGQERCAIVWKHRDGLTQRRIGDLLGVGEARVSRIVSAAVATLAEGIRSALDHDGDGPGGAALWDRLAAAVSDHWSRVDVEVPPPSGGPPTGAAPAGSVPHAAPSESPDQ